MRPTLIQRGIRRICAFVLAAAALCLPEQPAAEEEVIEEIVVTGSRIPRDANLTGALPVQTVAADDIRASGEFSLLDVVNDIPSLLSSVTAEQSIDSGVDGANTLNLRGLGTERTLVLVDGRRHVGGLQGTSAVDVGSIPHLLVDRVEVLTGGASAVYGADAVTGVVNFILRRDFEGLTVDAQYGLSEYGDAGQSALAMAFGRNLAGERGNITFALDIRKDNGLQAHERADGLTIGSSRDWVNPALRFQQGDIGPDTPNFSRYFNFANTGLIQYGLPIPAAGEFIAGFTEEFGAAPVLTAAESALMSRAAGAPQRAVLPRRTFPFTSGYGYIIPGNPFTRAGFDPETPIDLDGNGNPDCLDSFTGYNSVLGRASYGLVGGCWNIDAQGNYRPIRDGLVAGDFQGFGGDSYNVAEDGNGDILLPEDKLALNLMGHWALSDAATAFAELKLVTQRTAADSRPTSFWDLLFGAADNPFLPDFIRDLARQTGGVAITIDPLLFDSTTTTRRKTFRLVSGVEGEFANGAAYEVSANIARFSQRIARTGAVINDRFFAAIDAVTDPVTGLPACRADVDANAPPGNTPFRIPAYEAGYFSYTPGSGDCVPLNIWAGLRGVTPDAADWVTTAERTELTIDQRVVFAGVTGDTARWLTLPGGAIGFALGAEYRQERSDARLDPWQRGILPNGSPYPAGALLSDVSENDSLTFRPQIARRNETGEYDATDLFAEFSLPLLADAPLSRELTFDASARWSSYSTIGSTASWTANLLWSPSEDWVLRGSVSQAVRAPNITELFGPETGTAFRPADPCDAAQIRAIEVEEPMLAANFRKNCAADFGSFGLDPFDSDGNYAFADPLSASFDGIRGGNAGLDEETADTHTYGVVVTPSFLPGFSLTIDYWDIVIDSAIQAVSAQDIVDGCYRGATLNTSFCELFTRNADPASAQFGGFNFIRSTEINFARLESRGIDVSATFAFDFRGHGFTVGVIGTRVMSLDHFTNPNDEDEIDMELGEIRHPRLSGSIFAGWNRQRFAFRWQSQFAGEMLLNFLEVDTARTLYGDAVFMRGSWIHDFNVRFSAGEQLTLYAGVNNVSGERPFATNHAFPASPRGRMFFLGGSYGF